MPLLKREPDIFPADLFDLPLELRPWSVAHVRSRQEKALARYLVQKQIPFYLPQTENEIITSRIPLSSRAQRGTSQLSTHEQHDANREANRDAKHDANRGAKHDENPESPSHRPSPLASRPSSVAHRPSPFASRPSPSSSRLRVSHNPLFPGYVFLRNSVDERMAVRQADVIVSLLEVVDQRSLADELAQLRDLQAAGAWLIPHPWLGPGDPVKITEGSFKGYRGVVIREHGRERLIVSIDLVRQSVAVDFEREMLAPDLFPVHQTRASERARARSRF